MNIECPSCHLTGTINEVELPPEGRNFTCPKCKCDFFIEKPIHSAGDKHLMNMCPVCHYSTFTDEMFAVCPKCGTNGADYREMLLKKSQPAQQNSVRQNASPEDPNQILDQEQMLRDYELLTRSQRNPDFDPPPSPETAAETKRPALPLPVRITGWALVTAGVLFLIQGLVGLNYYHGSKFEATFSTPYIGSLYKFRLFLQYGFLPWLTTVFSICFISAASQFFYLRPWVPEVMRKMCLVGIGLVLVRGVVDIINRIIVTSGFPSAIFYIDCLFSFMLKTVLWSAPFLASIWLLTRDDTVQDYQEVRAASCENR